MLAYICTCAPSQQVVHGVLRLVQPLWLERQAYDAQLQVPHPGVSCKYWLQGSSLAAAGTLP